MLNNKLHIISLLLVIFMSLAQLLFAQEATLSNDRRFSVDLVKGCAPLSVEVTELIVINETRQFWYTPVGSNERLDLKTPPGEAAGKVEFNFPEPGSYYIVQIQQQTHPLPQYDTITIEVKEPKVPYFEASNCGNGQVWIEAIRDSSQYDYYIINGDYNRELNASNDYQRAVSLPLGSQTITVRGMYRGEGVNNNDCGYSSQDITVTSELQPALINEVRASIADQSVLIRYTLHPDAYQVLEVQNASGTFVAQDGQLEDNQTHLSLDPSNNYYCFRIRTDNRCNGTSEYSNIVCSAQLSGTAEENHNRLTFNSGNQPSSEASLLRDGNIIHSFGTAGSGTYEDEQIVCNTPYSYAVTLTYPDARSITEGLELQNQFSGTPSAPQNLASRWEGPSTVIFEFLQDNPIPDARYRAYQAEGNPPKLSNRADTNLIPVAAAAANTCYRFSYVDACNNESELSEPVCALYLRNVAREPDGLLLEWDEYTGYANGVQRYTVTKYTADGNFDRSYPMGLQTSLDLGEQALEESGSQYVVTAFSNDMLTESSSNIYEFRIIMEGYFPNAFTPNGDEQNDYFTVKGKFVEKCRLQIFNRWGEQIYETTDVEKGWDGTVKGQPAPQDTYIYRAFVETLDGGQQTQRGSVFLLRK